MFRCYGDDDYIWLFQSLMKSVLRYVNVFGMSCARWSAFVMSSSDIKQCLMCFSTVALLSSVLINIGNR